MADLKRGVGLSWNSGRGGSRAPSRDATQALTCHSERSRGISNQSRTGHAVFHKSLSSSVSRQNV